jgi:cephalosporin hydroxylase
MKIINRFLGKLIEIVLTKNWFLPKIIINLFHIIWYHASDTWHVNTFLGYPICQCPFDMQLYQEIIFNVRPSFIIQTGVFSGGSLLFFSHLLDIIDAPPDALVIGVDILLNEKSKTLSHPRIRLIEGDSVDPKTISQLRELLPSKSGLVSLDSNHQKGHVQKELALYNEFVGVGSYLVVEDTNINGHPVNPFWGPGPFEAVKDYLKSNKNFIIDDHLWEKNKFSFHQGGWLKRITD